MCYCAECDTLGGKLMTEAELISHQRILCKTRMHVQEIADFVWQQIELYIYHTLENSANKIYILLEI